MDPAKLKAAIECIKNNDGDAALVLLEEMLTAVPGADPAAPDSALTEGADPAKVDPAAPGAAAAKTPAAPAAAAVDPVALRTAVETALIAMVPGAKTYDQAKAALSGAVTGRSAEELTERQGLIADLVGLRVEDPSTAWEGDAAKRAPVARLLAEPIADLRARVAKMKESRPAQARAFTAPVVAEGDLTESERDRVAKMKPEQKERFLALRAGRRKAS